MKKEKNNKLQEAYTLANFLRLLSKTHTSFLFHALMTKQGANKGLCVAYTLADFHLNVT